MEDTGLSAISGTAYATAQTLVQQVAYALSDRLFTYSAGFDLDVDLQRWSSTRAANARGYPTAVQQMQTRQGAGSIALGYVFSRDFDLSKRHLPQSLIASSASLQHMRPALEQLSLLYSLASPLVAHVVAAEYDAGSSRLASDYASALSLAEELGLALVCSRSAHESQHMALFSTLLAAHLPVVHIYDGGRVGRETTSLVDVLGQAELAQRSGAILARASGPTERHLSAEGKLLNLLHAFNEELGTQYAPFEYHGHPEATAVLVVFGSVEASLAGQVVASLAGQGVRVGVVNVRVYRPFVEEAFLKVLPATTQTVGVLGQVQTELAVHENGVHAALYEDVLAALTFGAGLAAAPECVEIKYAVSQSWSLSDISAVFQRVLPQGLLLPGVFTPKVQQFVVLDVDSSSSGVAALDLAKAFAADSTQNVAVNTIYDNLRYGGIARTDIRLSSSTISTLPVDGAADIVYIGDVKLLSELDVLASAADGAKVILHAPGLKDTDLDVKLPADFRLGLARRDISLFVVDSSAQDSSLSPAVFHAAFLHVAFPDAGPEQLEKLAPGLTGAASFDKVVGSILRQITIPESWKTVEEGSFELVKQAADLQPTSFSPFDKEDVQTPPVLGDWQAAAKALAFKEAYDTKAALRPDLATKTFTVHVKENRRLTPVTYDRNIFHIEFDLGDSGLTYDIGEALGIHGENTPADINKFIDFYGLNPNDIVQVPSRDNVDVLESRTVYHALQHHLDLFGKPPKRFYESLAEFASDEKEKAHLLKLGSAEGADEFKRRSEVDMVTFADILEEFPSAHPSFHDLIKIVSPMKRREYSIASCQKVTPDSVALMIVVVNWIDSRGTQRYGQSSHYLSKLKPGAPVTVSVKPSVMKLPPRSTQPLIMAGLGTGLAPFRAFVQHRAIEKAQGKEIGAVLLYMGSRHQREEYCYGEEWEAYQAAGVITLLGRAFSRDQEHKIYIQDRMRETLPQIAKAYLQEEGAFYLCGPTWPVPDVTSVLEEAIAMEAQRSNPLKKIDPRKEIERLKEEERYVLEVY
ncbi:uncharacterized protein GIQ15_01922 [Arthroderma uncinatum]|uniref:uncharacterized protein n=1 Tax=Arthroderma uncinatum TaxID=74035 RepID=UPI00144A97E4|nr:uncharacterized protein GIQ15_01922 [Arthroderma uncinatum]KAF3492405.1 hypothetical protein GIQ15_01922 [Arthroderma uncinatum]